MKRPFKSAFLMFVPVPMLLGFGLLLSSHRQKEHARLVAYYSQPFTPYLELEHSKTFKSELAYEIKADGFAIGGQGDYHWYLRGVLFELDGAKSRLVWQSNLVTNSTGGSSVCFMNGWQSTDGSSSYRLKKGGPLINGNTRPSPKTTYMWRFRRPDPNIKKVKMIVEAVAVPLPVPETELGKSGVSINSATPAKIAAARQQPGAKYMRESIVVDAQK